MTKKRIKTPHDRLKDMIEKTRWIYKNPESLASLKREIKNVEGGRLHDLGSFAKFTIGKDEYYLRFFHKCKTWKQDIKNRKVIAEKKDILKRLDDG